MYGRTLLLSFAAALVAALAAGPADAGGLLVPRTPGPPIERGWRLERTSIRASVIGATAFVTVEQTFENVQPRTLEAEFVFALPPSVSIGSASVFVGGEGVESRLLRGDAARAHWVSVLGRRKDTALIELLGRDLLVAEGVSLPPGARRTVTAKYDHEVRSHAGEVELLLPLRAATVSTAPDAELSVEIDVDLGHGQQRGSSRRGFDSRADTRDRVEIGPVYSPTHDVSVLRDEARHAVIRFDGPLGPREPDLRAFWTTTRSAVGATLLTYWPEEEARGYFLLVAQPSRFESVRLETRPKDLTFVIDTSGSMDGDRLEQVRLVLEAQVEALDAQDRLNVVAYGDTVRKLWPEPRSLEGAARAQALRFVRALEAGGGTNVDAALATALAAPRSPERSAVVVFVTDGRPTRGETSHTGILDHVRQANAKHPARVFGLGLGVDVDSVLLDRLALENGGLPAYVRPRADARPALEALLRAFDEPVLARVALALRGIGAEDVLPERLPDVVRGGTLFVTGRYAREGRPEIVLGEREGRVRQEYGTLLWAGGPGDVSLGAFPARIWALRRIAAHVDALRLRTAEAPGRVRELVTLSTRHGLLTEYTAFLADEGADHTAHAANVALAAKMLADYRTPGVGALGLAQAMNQAARRDALRAPPRAEGGWLPDSGGRTISRVRWPGVRQVGELAWFYRRGVGWVDARVPDTGVVDAEVARWTPAFFELLETTSAQENAGLAQSGPVLIRVGERTVRVVD